MDTFYSKNNWNMKNVFFLFFYWFKAIIIDLMTFDPPMFLKLFISYYTLTPIRIPIYIYNYTNIHFHMLYILLFYFYKTMIESSPNAVSAAVLSIQPERKRVKNERVP